MIHTLLDLGCEVSCLPAGYVDPSENWVTIAEDIPLAAEILAFAPYGPEGVSRVFAERQGYYDYLVVSRPTTMEYLHPLLSRHPEWLTGMKLIYDAEAIYTLVSPKSGCRGKRYRSGISTSECVIRSVSGSREF